MRRLQVLAIAGAAAIAACGGGDESTMVSVYANTGAVQCTGGGLTLSQQRAQLEQAGVTVHSASCGHDGIPVPAVCGASAGTIGIFGISSDQVALAANRGFATLSSLPSARAVPCS
jgi:hypothetical protein